MKTLKCYKGMEAADNTVKTGDIIKNNDSVNAKKVLVHSGDAKDIEQKTNEPEHDIVVDSYYNLTHDKELKKIPGQAHHTFQNAAFKKVIDREEACCVKLEGDLLKSSPGTPHYKFHEYMENWWDQFRSGGDRYEETPTVQEYSEAAEKAYIVAGLDPVDAKYAVDCSKEQFAEWYTFRKIENEFGNAVGGFTSTERDTVLAYIGATIRGEETDCFDKTISDSIYKDITDSVFSKIDNEIGDRGKSYIDDVINDVRLDYIPHKIHLKTGETYENQYGYS